ncbi:MAG: ATP-binding cassette domain-containing protein [Siculibacillus sp.]
MPVERLRSLVDRPWLRAVRHRVQGTPASAAPEPIDPASLPPCEPLARLLSDIATVWAAERFAVELGARADELLESPEALSAFAARHDIDIVFENRTVASLAQADLPAVMLTRVGTGRMLVGRTEHRFVGRSDGRTYEIDHATLAGEEAGTLFLVRSRSLARIEPIRVPADEVAGAANARSREDPVREVIDHILTRQRGLIGQLMVAAVFSNLMMLALPVYTGLIFDRVIPHSAFDTLWAVSIGVMIALLADLAVRWVRMKLQDAVAGAASAKLQASIVRRLVEVKMMEAPRSAGAVTIRLREIDGLTQVVPQLITGVAVDAPFLLVVFGLIWMNGGAAVVAPIAGMATLMVVHHVANLVSEKELTRAMRLAQIQTNQLIETVEGLEAVKTTRTERRVLGRFERIFDEYSWSSHVARLWNGFAAYANVTIGQAMVVLVLMIGAFQVAHGEMTIGGLSTCSLLVGRVITPIGQLVGALHRVHQSRRTLRSLAGAEGGAIEEAGDTSGVLGVPRDAGIRVQGVSFAYPGQTTSQIEGADITIRPGEKVAIIGRTGSGKSTLLKLMTRLLEPDRGSILVDDMDSRQYQPQDLRKAIGYMGQTAGLVDDTLLVNLTLGVDKIDPARLEAVARLTGVAEFVARHPQGFAMQIGPRGERLSGGERQSVVLARLLLADPKVLLLDEPTASMDTLLEARLVRDLKAHLGDRTLIVATHRAPILELADRLIWLDGGRVMADGPKAEVLRRLSGAAA